MKSLITLLFLFSMTATPLFASDKKTENSLPFLNHSVAWFIITVSSSSISEDARLFQLPQFHWQDQKTCEGVLVAGLKEGEALRVVGDQLKVFSGELVKSVKQCVPLMIWPEDLRQKQ